MNIVHEATRPAASASAPRGAHADSRRIRDTAGPASTEAAAC
jgi:hypothetical protein